MNKQSNNETETAEVALKFRIWKVLEFSNVENKLSRQINFFLISLILINVIAVVLGSVEWISTEYNALLEWIEIVSVAVFTIEYLIRLWSCTAAPKYRSPVTGRLKFALTPMAIIDLIAIVPFFLPLVTTLDLRIVRVLRLMRIFRLAKIGRYSSSIRLVRKVLVERKEELVVTLFTTMILLILSSSLMYYAEGEAQPDKFPDIPSSLWWAVATLTTVGYGDVYPITPLGKLIGGIVAMLGVGLFALPTGILGAGFVDVLREKKAPAARLCAKCGCEVEEEE